MKRFIIQELSKPTGIQLAVNQTVIHESVTLQAAVDFLEAEEKAGREQRVVDPFNNANTGTGPYIDEYEVDRIRDAVFGWQLIARYDGFGKQWTQTPSGKWV